MSQWLSGRFAGIKEAVHFETAQDWNGEIPETKKVGLEGHKEGEV